MLLLALLLEKQRPPYRIKNTGQFML